MNIRIFYESNLKVKLVRFLHESNIEFIQRQVKVEDYMQRRKMRTVMRVLYKYSKMQQAYSSFSRMPTPKAMYMIHLWLQMGTFSFKDTTRITRHPGLKY